VAALDPLRDDGKRYARALTAAGVPVRYTNYVRMPHGFLSMPRLSRSYPQAVEEIIQELLAVTGAIYSERP
jgi:acetyl esterase